MHDTRAPSSGRVRLSGTLPSPSATEENAAMDTRPVYTLSSTPAVIGSHDEAVERARGLRDRLRERLPQGQELRRLPDETVAEILESGLYGVMKPRRYGGSE